MAKLTIFKPDNSCADIIDVSDSLYKKLKEMTKHFALKYLDLAFLKETQERALYMTAKKFEGKKQEKIKDLASSYLDWFDELLDVIVRIENLENPDYLCIYLSN